MKPIRTFPKLASLFHRMSTVSRSILRVSTRSDSDTTSPMNLNSLDLARTTGLAAPHKHRRIFYKILSRKLSPQAPRRIHQRIGDLLLPTTDSNPENYTFSCKRLTAKGGPTLPDPLLSTLHLPRHSGHSGGVIFHTLLSLCC